MADYDDDDGSSSSNLGHESLIDIPSREQLSPLATTSRAHAHYVVLQILGFTKSQNNSIEKLDMLGMAV